ncbi:MAG: aspartate 1-decarboxylase [Actinobacteria bacterium]|nr:aspartate 1-decarboxylase [Actinomycetota bacterium]
MSEKIPRYRKMLKSKIQRAIVTDADIHYTGSITIDRRLMEIADLYPYEQVHVWDVDTGSRVVTYVIEGEKGSGEICMNGAAARLIHTGDRVIIASFISLSEKEAVEYHPRIVFVDDKNRAELLEDHLTADDFC